MPVVENPSQQDTVQKVISRSSTAPRTTKKSINVDQLDGRICYFSLAGDLALKAYEDIKLSTFAESKKKTMLKLALIERLYCAILMFDKVVLHCSDPLRSEVVLEVLEAHKEWITSGRILFVFSRKIQNIRSDYRNYIEKKVSEYSDGDYSKQEAESLRSSHITEDYYKRVIDLLDTSTLLVRKSKNTNTSFDKLVLNDLNQKGQTEQVIVDSTYSLSHILFLSLSLSQLLNVRRLIHERDESEGKGEFIFPLEVTKKVRRHIVKRLEQGNTIARSAIVGALRTALSHDAIDEQQENILEAITLRMDVLYCHMNSGKHLILEFHPSYEHRSSYQMHCFYEYIKLMAKRDSKIELSPDMINKLLDNESINSFRIFYLACMADTREVMNLTHTDSVDPRHYQEDFLTTFKDVVQNRNSKELNSDKFTVIGKILRGEVS